MQKTYTITCRNRQVDQYSKIKRKKGYGGGGGGASGGGPFPKKALTCGLVR